MSLVVWLPLNGNLDNQGLSNVTVTNHGATVDNNGKIGKCYSFNGDVYLNLSKGIDTTKDYSICYWFKEFENNTLNQFRVVYQCGNLIVGQYGSALNIYNAAGSGLDVMAAIDTTTWHHACFTFQSSENLVTIYIDGKYAISKTATSIPTSDSYAIIGKRSSGTYLFQGNLNDVRIYDHCLSTKEVKDLAKGLVLHYRLAGPGRPNLLTGTGPNDSGWDINQYGGTFTKTVTNDCTTFNVTAKATSWFLYCHTLPTSIRNSLKVNTTYTYSFEAKSNVNLSLGISLLCSNSTNPMSNNRGVAILGDNQWHKYSVQLTTIADFSKLTATDQYFYMAGGNALSTVSFRNAKFEEGSVATPWCPNSADALYSAMGYNNNIEYDCSGYRHNGTKSGTITWDVNSPRYTTSYKFNTGSDYIKTNFSKTMDELSISFWVKPSSSNGGYSIICSNYNNPSGGLWIATNCEGCSVWAYRGAYMNVSGSLANNTWHHCVYTFKAGVSKWYINGEEKALTGNTYTGTTLWIGDLTIGNSYTGTLWNTKRYGNLSDFRLYSTALSAEDIAELYHSAVIVDNTGKSYAYEYFEAN